MKKIVFGYMVGLIRTIAIILIIYYAFKIIGRYILPLFFKKVVRNAEKKFREQQQYQDPPQHGKVGETVIDKKPSKNRKKSNKELGDYVDYEELND